METTKKCQLTKDIVEKIIKEVLAPFGNDIKHIKIKETNINSPKRTAYKRDENFLTYTNAFSIKFKLKHLKCKVLVSQYFTKVSCIDENNLNNSVLSQEIQDNIGKRVVKEMYNHYGDEYANMLKNTLLEDFSIKYTKNRTQEFENVKLEQKLTNKIYDLDNIVKSIQTTNEHFSNDENDENDL